MTGATLSQPHRGWLAQVAGWLAGHARRRRERQDLAAMEARELHELGFSHAAAAESGIRLTECGGVRVGSWIHAEPCFPSRARDPRARHLPAR